MWVLDTRSEVLCSGTQQGGFTDPGGQEALPDLGILDKPEKNLSHTQQSCHGLTVALGKA